MSTMTVLLIIWGAITVVFVALIIWKSLVGMREDDQIFLDEAEASMEQEQRQIIAKVQRLESYAKGFGIASAALLLVAAGLWIYRGFTQFSNPTIP